MKNNNLKPFKLLCLLVLLVISYNLSGSRTALC